MTAINIYHNAAIKLFPNYNTDSDKKVNEFLEEYNDNIIDIQISEHNIMIVYRYKED